VQPPRKCLSGLSFVHTVVRILFKGRFNGVAIWSIRAKIIQSYREPGCKAVLNFGNSNVRRILAPINTYTYRRGNGRRMLSPMDTNTSDSAQGLVHSKLKEQPMEDEFEYESECEGEEADTAGITVTGAEATDDDAVGSDAVPDGDWIELDSSPADTGNASAGVGSGGGDGGGGGGGGGGSVNGPSSSTVDASAGASPLMLGVIGGVVAIVLMLCVAGGLLLYWRKLGARARGSKDARAESAAESVPVSIVGPADASGASRTRRSGLALRGASGAAPKILQVGVDAPPLGARPAPPASGMQWRL
jgi:hypothetical protein